MTEILLYPGEDELVEDLGRDGEIYIYPSHAEKGFMAGFGIIRGKLLQSALAGLDRDMLKFYARVSENIPFVFLGSTFYRKELERAFGLKPFLIRDGAIVYYTSDTHNPEIENYCIDVKNSTHEYFDGNRGELNPLIHLIDLSRNGWRKEAYKDALKACIKRGFLTNWNNINELHVNELELSSSELEKESGFNILNGRILQKWLNRAVNDLTRLHSELFRDLCMIAISSDSESSLQVFKNLYTAITEEVTREKITRKEFPVKMIIKDIELQFKMSLPRDKEKMVFHSLKSEFKDVKLVYAPEARSGKGDGGLRKSKLHRFSITVGFNKEYQETQIITWIDAVIDTLVNSVREINAAWHISKKYVWVKRLWIEITAPRYFREDVVEALRKTGWMVVSWDERTFKDDVWKVGMEIWCDYPLYELKSRKETDLVMRSEFRDFEELDKKLYGFVFPTRFIIKL